MSSTTFARALAADTRPTHVGQHYFVGRVSEALGYIRWRVSHSHVLLNYQTLEKVSAKMLERYDCDDINDDRSTATSVNRFTSDHHGTHHATAAAAGRLSAAERHTQIFW